MKLISPAIMVAVVLAGGVVYFYSRSTDDQPATNSTTSAPTETPANSSASAPSSNQQTTPGAYVDYSSSIIAETDGTKILFFHAPWCQQCRALESSIKSNEIPIGVTIIKVDYDTNQALRQKYGVTIQTTLVKVDDEGNLVKKYVAYDQPNLESLKNNLQ